MSTNSKRSQSGTISLRDLAKAAGVSRMTVSRAFKEGAKIRPELRDKILKIAEEYGYKPDRMVSEIMSNFANQRQVDYRETIAVLWWPGRWQDANLPANNYSNIILKGLQNSANLHACKLEHISMTKEMTPPVINRILIARNIQSVAITPPPSHDCPAPELDWSQFSVVVIGATLNQPRFHRSRMSHYQSMVIALKKLQALGCQRPCLLVNQELEQRMNRAYTAAFSAWNKDYDTMLWRGDPTKARGLKAWIKERKPDVVIADVCQWQKNLTESHATKRFVAMDVMSPTSEISGIYQNNELMAEYAVDLLMRIRLRKETGIPEFPLTIVCDGAWTNGRTFQPREI